jgi:hypothetical protein
MFANIVRNAATKVRMADMAKENLARLWTIALVLCSIEFLWGSPNREYHGLRQGPFWGCSVGSQDHAREPSYECAAAKHPCGCSRPCDHQVNIAPWWCSSALTLLESNSFRWGVGTPLGLAVKSTPRHSHRKMSRKIETAAAERDPTRDRTRQSGKEPI